MKQFNSPQRQFDTRKIIFLWYGTENPIVGAKPIISLGIVANLVKMPYEKVKWMVRSYFNKKKQRANPKESIQPPKLNPPKLHKSEKVTLVTIK